MLTIKIPNKYYEERRYALDVIFSQWLGLEWNLKVENRKNTSLSIDESKKVIIIPDIFFNIEEKYWLDYKSMPKSSQLLSTTYFNYKNIHLEKNDIPVIFGDFESIEKSKDDIIEIPIDIIGSTFYMLSRYEELVVKDRDKYNRFLAKYSNSKKNGYLQRPIIDEYITLLTDIMKNIWPNVNVKKINGKMIVSCDVDEPYERWITSPIYFLKGLAGSLVRHRSINHAINRIKNAMASYKEDYRYDQNWNFDWYMNKCEENGHTATFYFIANKGKSKYDAIYSIEDERIRKLIKKIIVRGHNIGLHSSFNTYNNELQLKSEYQRLNNEIDRSGGLLKGLNRQHYLKWDARLTPSILDNIGLLNDSIGYSDMPGFRFGTSRTFKMWGWERRSQLNLTQTPLIMMESSVISSLGLGHSEEALHLMTYIKNIALKYGGNFNLLWHNSSLLSNEDRFLFEKLLK